MRPCASRGSWCAAFEPCEPAGRASLGQEVGEVVHRAVEAVDVQAAESVEDKECVGAVRGQLGAASLTPVPAPTGDPGVVTPHDLARGGGLDVAAVAGGV